MSFSILGFSSAGLSTRGSEAGGLRLNIERLGEGGLRLLKIDGRGAGVGLLALDILRWDFWVGKFDVGGDAVWFVVRLVGIVSFYGQKMFVRRRRRNEVDRVTRVGAVSGDWREMKFIKKWAVILESLRDPYLCTVEKIKLRSFVNCE